MRRQRVELSEVARLSALVRAARQSARASSTKPETQRFMCEVERRCGLLSDALFAGVYQPSPYTSFMIRDPKVRRICAAPFPDRVVHHSLCAALEPRFERYAYDHSYACRKGKGSHVALRAVQRALGWGVYALKLDIEHYFETLPHAPLKALVRRLVKGPEVLRLCDALIDHVPEGGVPGCGLPIGNLTSQHFANLYLGQLDHWVGAESGAGTFGGRVRYVRYMDDLVLVARDREVLRALELRLGERVSSLGLKLKDKARELAPIQEGMSFLGCRVWPSMVRFDGARKRRLFRKLQWLSRCALSDDEVQLRLSALSAWADHCGARSLLFSWLSRGVDCDRSGSGAASQVFEARESWRELEQQREEPSRSESQQQRPR